MYTKALYWAKNVYGPRERDKPTAQRQRKKGSPDYAWRKSENKPFCFFFFSLSSSFALLHRIWLPKFMQFGCKFRFNQILIWKFLAPSGIPPLHSNVTFLITWVYTDEDQYNTFEEQEGFGFCSFMRRSEDIFDSIRLFREESTPLALNINSYKLGNKTRSLPLSYLYCSLSFYGIIC